jgi:hypothetical protein
MLNPKSKIANPKLPDPRHAPVREEIWRIYMEANNGLQCPWSGKHAKLLARTLETARNWDVPRWHTCVLNRFASEGVNPAEDPAEWIPRLVSYARQPLNRFSKTDRVPAECFAKMRALYARYAESRSQKSGVRSQEKSSLGV